MAILLGFTALILAQITILCHAINNGQNMAFKQTGVNDMKYPNTHRVDFTVPKVTRASEQRPNMLHGNSMKYTNKNSDMFPESGSRVARQDNFNGAELGQKDFDGSSPYTPNEPNYNDLHHPVQINQKSTHDTENNLRNPRGFWDRRTGGASYDTADVLPQPTGDSKDPWYLVNAYYHESGNSNYRPWKFHPKDLMLPTTGTQSNINRPGQTSGRRFRKWIIL